MANIPQILDKLNIAKLNPMQTQAMDTISNNPNTVILSPTGSGKTLAFLLPLISILDEKNREIQALIVVPSRELAIQIEQVARNMGSGFKINAVYGGRAGSKDKIEIKHRPAILIGTPGRISDHIRREVFDVSNIKTIILDEYDKSLEIGFEDEMIDIISSLPNLERRILTSATQGVEIPSFVNMKDCKTINFLQKKQSLLKIKTVMSPTKDKLDILVKTLCHIGDKSGIIFCNYKDTIQRVSEYLDKKGVSHGCFYGGMEQKDRERALIKFRNGTHNIIIATDLAARGIDIQDLDYIVHYQLPLKKEEFTHRNGRTARMNSKGTAYVFTHKDENLPEFIENYKEEILQRKPLPQEPLWATLFISGGRKDKISKGDIVGMFLKKAGLDNDKLGTIELKQDCAFVSVHKSEVFGLIEKVNNTRLKKKKVRISLI
ncbi:MAG: DEAD/DEAH box helicase [Flavobacteriaceae bacterium]|nr:DEAD/DEAH box helicase [Flavobacteriaceae bacterium]